ncbi:MAG: glycosyltransferase family 9 protein [Gammaproteobacteria bacterium]
MPRAPSHILILRTDNIGDVVLTLPLAGYLKQILPGVRVDFLVRAYAAPVVRQCRFVDEVLSVEQQDPDQLFQQGGYDTVIFAYPNRRLATAARRARVPNRVGTSHRLFHWLTCNRLAHFSRVKSPLHEAQLNFELLKPLGIDHIPPLPDIAPLYGLQAPHLAQAEALRAQAPFNLILHPKSNGNGREWPLTRYTELAVRLQADSAVRIWITGSPAEGELIARQAPDLLALPNVRNLCGQFDLAGLVALIGVADGLIASGTGPLHISTALGRPTLGLFPPIKPIDAARWGALGSCARSLTATQPCAGCTDPTTCGCMLAIDAAQVEQVVLGWRHTAHPVQPAQAVDA